MDISSPTLPLAGCVLNVKHSCVLVPWTYCELANRRELISPSARLVHASVVRRPETADGDEDTPQLSKVVRNPKVADDADAEFLTVGGMEGRLGKQIGCAPSPPPVLRHSEGS